MLLASVRIQLSDQRPPNESYTLHRPTKIPPPRNTVECTVLPKQIVLSTARRILHQAVLPGTQD
jgi:hypothetical protein